MTAIAAVVLTLALAGCGNGGPSGFAALVGKRIPGTSAAWFPIANRVNNVRLTVPDTSAAPLLTWVDSAPQSVEFFDFPNSADAASFYAHPPLSADFLSSGARVALQPMPGYTGASRVHRVFWNCAIAPIWISRIRRWLAR